MIINNKCLWLILLLAFFLRTVDFSWPDFSTDELRVIARGHSLASYGVDELGRAFPLIFNSSTDYQLPLSSYLAAFISFFFGKSEIGIRILFILIGVLVVFCTFILARAFFPKVALSSALIAATAPTLIYFSKIPNNAISLTLLIQLIILTITQSSVGPLLPLLLILLADLTSKTSWFITPFLVLILLLSTKKLKVQNVTVLIASVVLSTIFFIFILNLPQGKRSLLENNFSLISNPTVINGLNTARGEGISAGWARETEKILFNKSTFIFTGIIQMLETFQLSRLFSNFDPANVFGFLGLGAFSKILIVPFLVSLVHFTKQKKLLFLLGYFLVFAYPAFFLYPQVDLELIVITLPMLSILIACGLSRLNKHIQICVLVFTILEILLGFKFTPMQSKLTSQYRPSWIKPIIIEAQRSSLNQSVAFSDKIVPDLAPYINYYSNKAYFASSVDSHTQPYKVVLTNLGNVTLVPSKSTLYSCDRGQYKTAFIDPGMWERLTEKGNFSVAKQFLGTDLKLEVVQIKGEICQK